MAMVLGRFFYSAVSCLFLVATVLASVHVAVAQSTAQPLIARSIDESSLVELKGNVYPLAQAQFDRGPVSAAMPMQRLLLVLKRTPQQERALQQYLSSVEDENSPNFRHYLTPDQFGQQYGPAEEDIQQVVAWLNRQGLSVTKVAKSRMTIEFFGVVNQIETAFHTQIHRFSMNGQEHVANISEPMIPSALAPIVAGVSPLNDFYPHPQLIRGPSGNWDPSEKRFVPSLTLSASGTQYLFVTPGDVATIYDSPNALNQHLKSGQTTYDGTGITIGIVTNEDINLVNIDNYRSQFGLPNGSISIVTDGNGSNYGLDNTESTLDGEISSAIAPGAQITYYQAADTTFQSGVMLAILRAVEDNTVNILNVSYSGCELGQGAAGNQEVLNAWEQAAAQGIAVTVSSGDSGSAGCDNPDTQTVASHGLGVNALASTPYTVAVGGTDFDALPNSFSKYVSSTNSNNGTSVLGYIPENPWNNSTKKNGTFANNQAVEDPEGNTNIVGGGGGASSASFYDANGNVLGGYTTPLWQQQYETNAGVPVDQVRDLPDVSLFAANGFYNAAWAICLDADCNGSTPTISGVGGTSASAPAFAGILALINQKIGATTRLGQPNWVLYDLALTHPEAFHQITAGNNSVLCAPGSPNCAGNNFLSGYDAASSYNRATGLGTVDISNLVNNWTSVAKTQTQTSVSLTPTTVQHGQPVSITVSVNPSGASGKVAITTDANEKTGGIRGDSQTSVALSNGQASGNWLYFPGGTYNVFADYSGDGTYAGSISTPTQLTVTPENSIVQLSVTAVDLNGKLTNLAGRTAVYGTYVSIDAQPIGQSQASNSNALGDATGTIAFYDGTTGTPGTVAIDASGNAESLWHGLKAGTHSITASYSGDKSYNPSNSAAVTFIIQKDPTTVTMSADSSSTYGPVVSLTATVNPAVSVSTLSMSGTVTITDLTNGVVLGTPIVDSGRGLITIQASQLAMGSNNIVAAYSGDDNFAPSAQSAPMVVTCTAGCGNGTGKTLQLAFYPSTPASHTISAGTTSATPVSVLPGGGFTGAVNLTCSVIGTKAADINTPQCSFDPATVTITDPNLAVQSTLTVTSTAPVTTTAVVPQDRPWSLTRYSLTLACTIFLGFSTRRRASSLLRVLLCLAVLGEIMACGGGGGATSNPGGGGSTTLGTTPDTYTVTFHAADAATDTVTAQDYFTLQVN